MIKVIGACLIVISSSLFGIQVASYFSLRPRHLRSLQEALLRLDTEIMYGATPLPVALKKIGQTEAVPVYRIFMRAGELLCTTHGYTPAEAWGLALEQEWHNTALSREDYHILRAFGEGLGISDRDEQHKNITLTSLHLRREEEKAQRERDKNERLWRYGGFLLGLSIMLILL